MLNITTEGGVTGLSYTADSTGNYHRRGAVLDGTFGNPHFAIAQPPYKDISQFYFSRSGKAAVGNYLPLSRGQYDPQTIQPMFIWSEANGARTLNFPDCNLVNDGREGGCFPSAVNDRGQFVGSFRGNNASSRLPDIFFSDGDNFQYIVDLNENGVSCSIRFTRTR